MKSTYYIVLLAAVLSISCQYHPGNNSGKALTLAMEEDIMSLDPHMYDDDVTHSVLSNVYDRLVHFDRDMRITPALAVHWENLDDCTWRFHLRPNVKFHNGKLFTAGDVKYSLARAKAGKLSYYVAAVESVRVIDDLTLDVVTAKPSPVLLNKLTFIAIVPDAGIDFSAQAAGTGAYQVVDYQAGRSLVVSANEGYWAGPPQIKKAVFSVIPDDDERLRALLDGRLLLIREIDYKNISKTNVNPRVSYIISPGFTVFFLGINFKFKGPLLDQKVREAIFWALDPREISDASGMVAVPTDQLVTPYIVGYLPAPSQQRPQIDKAGKLLREAGYAGGFSVNMEMPQTSVDGVGAVIVRQLSQIGIRVKLIGLDWPAYTSRRYEQKIPFFLGGWICSSGDASDLFDACLHTRDKQGYGSANWGGYSNPLLDELIETSGESIDPGQRMRLLHQAMSLTLADLPLIPISIRSCTYGVNKTVSFTPRLDGYINLFDIGWTKGLLNALSTF